MQLAKVVFGPPLLAFLPAICLAAFWFGGEGALMVLAALLPIFYLLATQYRDQRAAQRNPALAVLARGDFEAHCADIFTSGRDSGAQSAIFCIAIEELDTLAERHGDAAAQTVMRTCGERLLSVLRTEDVVAQLGDTRLGVCTAPVRRMDMEACLQMANRLQTLIEEPISIDGLGLYVTSSVGFCPLKQAPGTTAADWRAAASAALREALRRGPSAVRAFSAQMLEESKIRTALSHGVLEALESGQIQPWFQPQISSDTGQVTGFEALARWTHPDRGVLPPAEFLPAVEQAGQLELLAEKMIYHSFAALTAWDAAGVNVPQVGVNFAGSELSNPKLVDKIKWELDRFDLDPSRLAVEVLETVVASRPDDMITTNIKALGDLGCRIDLDDFGTGNASIASIRRFAVGRIKIDRSFVMKADRDPDQQRMISAILTMAERLEIETLAEGVETVGEHVLLAQLGCDHVQGYSIGKPMPFDQTLDWIFAHQAKLMNMPRLQLGQASGGASQNRG